MRSLVALLALTATASAQPTPPMAPDIPAKFDPPRAADFVRREVMILMRDGVKLETFNVVPKGAKRAPMVPTRTPYDASKKSQRNVSNSMEAARSPTPRSGAISRCWSGRLPAGSTAKCLKFLAGIIVCNRRAGWLVVQA